MAFTSILNDRFPRQADVWFDRSPRATAPTQSRTADPAAGTDYSVHPGPILISLGCCAWFLFISWACFAPFDREAGLAIAVVTVIFAMYLGGIALGGFNSADNGAAVQRRSFREFLRGRVEIATGLVSGREALVPIAMLPVGLAIGATVMGLIWVSRQ